MLLNNKDKLRFAVSGGFYGKLGTTQYFARPLTTEEVANLYFRGPTGSQLYRIKLFNQIWFGLHIRLYNFFVHLKLSEWMH